MQQDNAAVDKVSMFNALKAANDFEAVGVAPKFPIDLEALEVAFKAQQKKMHPDQFSGENPTVQRMATQASARINDAYQRLKRPLTNAIALFNARFGKNPLQLRAADPIFLEMLLDWRELAEKAFSEKNEETLTKLENRVQIKIQSCMDDIAKEFDSKTADENIISGSIIRWHYLDKLSDDISSKVDTLLD